MMALPTEVIRLAVDEWFQRSKEHLTQAVSQLEAVEFPENHSSPSLPTHPPSPSQQPALFPGPPSPPF